MYTWALCKMWKSSVIPKEAVGNSWDILNAILSHIYHSNQSNGFISNEWVLLQSVKGELSVHGQLFCRRQHWGSLHVVTRKLDLDQTSMARKHTERQIWENSLFNQASWLFTPISNKFCIICCYYVCFGLLMQISLADYSAYLHELRVSCTLWSILRSISGWFLNFKSLFSDSVPPLNLNKFSEYCIK